MEEHEKDKSRTTEGLTEMRTDKHTETIELHSDTDLTDTEKIIEMIIRKNMKRQKERTKQRKQKRNRKY
jgi:hypothetical protein